MKIVSIIITNVLGIKHLEFNPGNVTEITGPNASGKSSVLKAIQFALKGGQDATMIRKGAEKGVTVLEFEDGTTVTRTLKQNGTSTTSVKHPEMGSITAGQTYLNKLYDAVGVNPVELMTAESSRRSQMILESMPIEVTRAQFEKAVDGVVELPPGIERGHALVSIENVRKLIYNQRTGENRLVKELDITIKQFTANLRNDLGDEKEIRASIDSVEKEVEKIRVDAKKEAGIYQKNIEQAEADIRACRTEISDIKNRAELDEMKVDSTAEVMREKLKAIESQSATKQTIREKKDEKLNHESVSNAFTEAIGRIESIKKTVISKIPLPVTLGEDGEIYHKGIPFSKLNTAVQVILAMRLAVHRSGKLKIICVDGLELLDSRSFSQFKSWAEKNPEYQFIVTRVSDGSKKELLIKTD